MAAKVKKKRNATKGMETRKQLLAAAERVFARHGFSQTTMRDIAKEADVAIGGIYFHYRSKEEVATAVLEQRIKSTYIQVESEVAALPGSLDIRSRIAVGIHAHVLARLEHGDFAIALRYARDSQLPRSVRKRHHENVDQYRQFWQGLMEEGQRAGVIRNDVSVGMLLFFMFGAVNWLAEWYDPKRKPVKALVDDFVAMLWDGIGRPAPPVRKSARKSPAGGKSRRPPA
jgi:AcrR family transcriptional regulator